MVDNKQNATPTQVVLAPKKETEGLLSGLQDRFDTFVDSLGDVLTDITALEVNTMVCRQITGEKFIPWQSYRNIYPISESYLTQEGIHSSLHERYLSLRRSLELEYTLLLIDTNSELYDPQIASNSHDLPILTESEIKMDDIETRMPDPSTAENHIKVQKLLANNRFLSVLRKSSELKAALDNRNQTLNDKHEEEEGKMPSAILEKEVKTDVIYAQTVIQVDGDIINRYSEEIFDHPQRDIILNIHKISVEAGHQEWRNLFGFVIDLVRNTLEKGFSSNLFSGFGRDQSNDSN